jgi:hypothetical protein
MHRVDAFGLPVSIVRRREMLSWDVVGHHAKIIENYGENGALSMSCGFLAPSDAQGSRSDDQHRGIHLPHPKTPTGKTPSETINFELQFQIRLIVLEKSRHSNFVGAGSTGCS